MICIPDEHQDHVYAARFLLWDDLGFAARFSLVCRGDDIPNVVVGDFWRMGRSEEGRPTFWLGGDHYSRDLRHGKKLLRTVTDETGHVEVTYPDAEGFSCNAPQHMLEILGATARAYEHSLHMLGRVDPGFGEIDRIMSASVGMYSIFRSSELTVKALNTELISLKFPTETAVEDAHNAAEKGVDLARVPTGGFKH